MWLAWSDCTKSVVLILSSTFKPYICKPILNNSVGLSFTKSSRAFYAASAGRRVTSAKVRSRQTWLCKHRSVLVCERHMEKKCHAYIWLQLLQRIGCLRQKWNTVPSEFDEEDVQYRDDMSTACRYPDPSDETTRIAREYWRLRFQ